MQREHAGISRTPEGTKSLVGPYGYGNRYRGSRVIHLGIIPHSRRQTGRGVKKPHSCRLAWRGHL